MTIDKVDIEEFLGSRNYAYHYYDIEGKKAEPVDMKNMKSGEELIKQHNESFAIMIDITDGSYSTTIYRCPFYRGKLVDPKGIDANKKSKAEFKPVSKEVFDFYTNFLVTKSNTSLVHAERSHINV
ncbi:hypothetical protein CL634_07670 [bacterium]|nr:hypothetical protein [bacterium]|tara:strand:+ start:302 stop:679 length:378 start_codon:yes stop_codon:yes gene_type:complete